LGGVKYNENALKFHLNTFQKYLMNKSVLVSESKIKDWDDYEFDWIDS
jgi:hypothetical protein